MTGTPSTSSVQPVDGGWVVTDSTIPPEWRHKIAHPEAHPRLFDPILLAPSGIMIAFIAIMALIGLIFLDAILVLVFAVFFSGVSIVAGIVAAVSEWDNLDHSDRRIDRYAAAHADHWVRLAGNVATRNVGQSLTARLTEITASPAATPDVIAAAEDTAFRSAVARRYLDFNPATAAATRDRITAGIAAGLADLDRTRDALGAESALDIIARMEGPAPITRKDHL